MPAPNFLFLITDQHRPDHTGFGGNPIIETPNLDALAMRGTVFDRAFVSNPICMPNRSTIMTGRMPSVHGTRFNGVSLDWRANTFVKALRKSGYRTTHIGKSHLQTMGISRTVLERLVDYSLDDEAVAAELPSNWSLLENFRRYRRREPLPQFDDFYGFERAEFAVLHGDNISGHYYWWLLEQGADPDAIQGAHNALDRYEGWEQVYQTATPVELHATNYIADRCVAEIDAAVTDARPFFIHCSWPDPHHPFTPPGQYWSLYAPADMLLPETFDDAHADSMPHYRTMIDNRGTQMFRPVDGWAPTRDQFQHGAAAEYGSITLIDDAIGRILTALDTSGVAADTVVIFTSDHGDMFGDHGLMLKHGMHYEGCTRVPLVIARPGRAGTRTASLASSIDLGQTILELADVAPYYDMQGVSLVPLLVDPLATVRDSVLVEEDQKDDQLGIGRPTRMRTLITDEARLTIYRGHEHGELFDLVNDPDEMENRFRTGAQLKQTMTQQLLEAMMSHANETPRPDFMA